VQAGAEPLDAAQQRQAAMSGHPLIRGSQMPAHSSASPGAEVPGGGTGGARPSAPTMTAANTSRHRERAIAAELFASVTNFACLTGLTIAT